jgi:hypothetical protein
MTLVHRDPVVAAKAIALKHFLARHGTTILMLDDQTTEHYGQDRPQPRSRRNLA